MKKRINLVIIIILIIICLLFNYIYIPYMKNNARFVIVNDNTIWMEKNNKWKSISKRHIARFAYNKLYSFDGSSYIGETYNDYSKNLTAYNKNYEPIILKNEIISIMSNEKPINTNEKNFLEILGEIDYTSIDEILNKYSITEDFQIKKYLIDIDNDGNTDGLFSINNFYMNDNDSKVFSIIFSNINGSVEVLDKVIVSKDEELKTKSIDINHVIDIDNDKKYEVILSKSSFGDVKNDCNELYEFDSKKSIYVKIIGC